MKKNTNRQTKQNTNKGLLTTIKTAKNKTRKRDKKKKEEKNQTQLNSAHQHATVQDTQPRLLE